MSKYNLTDLYKQVLNESMSRGGTINDSFYNIANMADELDGENEGKDTFPIEIQRLGPSEDGKTNEEIVVRFGPKHYDYFSIYDYKFGEDPTNEENYQKEYPFSLGIPTGGKDSKRYAMKLGFNVEGMPKPDSERNPDDVENDSIDMDDVREHFNRFK